MQFENKPESTEMLASVYKTTATNISNNFNNNEGKFEEGKHYILLQGNDLKEFNNQSYDIGVVKNYFTNSQPVILKMKASTLFIDI